MGNPKGLHFLSYIWLQLSYSIPELENTRAAGELEDVILESQIDRRRAAFSFPNRERIPREPQIERMAAIADAHVQALKFLGQSRIEPQDVARDFDSGQDALH